MSSQSSEIKRAAVARRRAERSARSNRRRERWACFWSWPLGHRYETPDGRGTLEAHSNGSGGGALPDLRCVGCRKPFGLLEDDR